MVFLLWNLQTMMLQAFKGHHNTINYIGITCDNEYIISTALDDSLRIWSISTQTAAKSFKLNSFVGILVSTDDDSEIDAESYGDCVFIERISERRKELIVFCNTFSLKTLAISYNSKYIVLTNDNMLKIIDMSKTNKHCKAIALLLHALLYRVILH